ncbi:competence type IV pilus ATPase ComGA [Loigolactobacillus zhaoyuanensis]|uniref:competence type IV pilus ATPase ComGA n=1 Tax=Loigolactobacillus zhaoyuanensis TaxID=2486017 RepID=UPI000F745F27|nr:competence type IV pilus ATPase ComGA [Loigolactobacillus zhaoyuanensis]
MTVAAQVTDLLVQCIDQQASDLYFLPYQHTYQLQMRTTGGITQLCSLPEGQAKEWLNHLKFTAKMALSETRRPQLGARQLEVEGQTIFLRLSTVGNFQNQESLVIRFIYVQAARSRYIFPQQFSQLTELCQQRGLVVFAGPTGSGKTTTLYQLAAGLGANKMVMAIEDPIEIFQPDFLQLQVNEAAAMTYPALLKVGLRHRPDILIVGEIRDEQTANVAVRAALSGHLVLSTVHARTARQVATRLNELGIEAATLAACLTGVSYQRLLPTTAGAAVLFDIYDPTQGGEGNESTWQQSLARAVKLGKIDLATQQAFISG